MAVSAGDLCFVIELCLYFSSFAGEHYISRTFIYV